MLSLKGSKKPKRTRCSRALKGSKKGQVLFLYLGVSMKCQIKIISRCYYSEEADKELKKGNFQTHVPSHCWLLNTRQLLPVGLQT